MLMSEYIENFYDRKLEEYTQKMLADQEYLGNGTRDRTGSKPTQQVRWEKRRKKNKQAKATRKKQRG